MNNILNSLIILKATKVLHMDIKPKNINIDKLNNKICNYGIFSNLFFDIFN